MNGTASSTKTVNAFFLLRLKVEGSRDPGTPRVFSLARLAPPLNKVVPGCFPTFFYFPSIFFVALYGALLPEYSRDFAAN